MAVFRFLQKCHKVLIYTEMGALCLLLLSMILMAFGQVVARNVWHGGAMWVEEVLRIEVLWIAFLGAALAAEFNRHVKIDILSHLLGAGMAGKILDSLAQIWLMLVCSMLFIASVDYINMERAYSSATMIGAVPDWVFRLVIPYFFVATVVRGIINIGRIAKGTHVRAIAH
ncbi:MAG: TRAP transporter small permease [Desulfatibacillaceae bacterium]